MHCLCLATDSNSCGLQFELWNEEMYNFMLNLFRTKYIVATLGAQQVEFNPHLLVIDLRFSFI